MKAHTNKLIKSSTRQNENLPSQVFDLRQILKLLAIVEVSVVSSEAKLCQEVAEVGYRALQFYFWDFDTNPKPDKMMISKS